MQLASAKANSRARAVISASLARKSNRLIVVPWLRMYYVGMVAVNSEIAIGDASPTLRLRTTSNGRLLHVGLGARGAVLGQDWVDKKKVSY
ncbi:hypothetical protein SAMN05444172_8398 [Burkholderia sp. GAS332]|nr:hypothetical protein SAMN05444172_8398 [Burkholderia sp. GAS332]